jgi:hypothetical protein
MDRDLGKLNKSLASTIKCAWQAHAPAGLLTKQIRRRLPGA